MNRLKKFSAVDSTKLKVLIKKYVIHEIKENKF